MRFKLTSESKKYLDSLDKESVKRLYDSMRKLTQDPPQGDIKPLKGRNGLYRLRVGDLRIIFSVEGNNVIIMKISPRGQAYKEV